MSKTVIEQIESALERPKVRNLLLGLTLGLMAINLWVALRSQAVEVSVDLSAVHVPQVSWEQVSPSDRHYIARRLTQLNELVEQLGIPLYRIRVDQSQFLTRKEMPYLERRLLRAWWTSRWVAANGGEGRHVQNSSSYFELSPIEKLAVEALVALSQQWLNGVDPGLTLQSPRARNQFDAPISLLRLVRSEYRGSAAKSGSVGDVDQSEIERWFLESFRWRVVVLSENQTGLRARRQFVQSLKQVVSAVRSFRADASVADLFLRIVKRDIQVKYSNLALDDSEDLNSIEQLSVRVIRICSASAPSLLRVKEAIVRFSADEVEWVQNCSFSDKEKLPQGPVIQIAGQPFLESIRMGWIDQSRTLDQIQSLRPDLIGNPMSFESWISAPVPLAVQRKNAQETSGS